MADRWCPKHFQLDDCHEDVTPEPAAITHGVAHDHPAWENCGGTCPARRARILAKQ